MNSFATSTPSRVNKIRRASQTATIGNSHDQTDKVYVSELTVARRSFSTDVSQRVAWFDVEDKTDAWMGCTNRIELSQE